jgi:hypothetical protein
MTFDTTSAIFFSEGIIFSSHNKSTSASAPAASIFQQNEQGRFENGEKLVLFQVPAWLLGASWLHVRLLGAFNWALTRTYLGNYY